jgi:hypothetical protein
LLSNMQRSAPSLGRAAYPCGRGGSFSVVPACDDDAEDMPYHGSSI